MIKKFTLSLLISLCCLFAFAGPVGLEQAKGKAAKFLFERGVQLLTEEPAYAPARLAPGVAAPETTPAYYVFNAEDNAGFVIISGDDAIDEVLGYSTSGNFDFDNMPSNVRAWMQGYVEQISNLATYSVPARASSNQLQAISPLITTKWNQDAPYNNMCPDHNGKKSVTGCTATAMAQVMNYHQWPKGKTTMIPSYITETHKLSVSALGQTVFAWDEMRDKYSTNDEGQSVAQLMRYCGQSLQSDYSSGETGAFSMDVPYALQTYFNYDQNMELKYIDFYTISEWEKLIYDELNAARPVMHFGYSMGGGHAFVCDGYDGKGLFHFNWGWGGSYDGYYKMVLLNPGTGGIGSGSADGYAYGQQIIVGVQPPTGEVLSKYFVPHSEQVIDKIMYSFFYNPHISTLTANVGFATIDENDEIISVIKDCCAMTLQGYLQQYQHIGLDLTNDKIKLSAGTHRIATVCRPQGSTIWKRVGSRNKYFEVTISSNGTITSIVQHPVINVSLVSATPNGNMVAGVKQNVEIKLKNEGDEFQTTLYMFASKTSTNKGEWQSRIPIYMRSGEEASFNLFFTPTTSGKYYIWITQDSKGESVTVHGTININSAPILPSNLSLEQCVVDKEEILAQVSIKNNSTEPYYREIVAILLEDLYGDGRVYGTEILNQPGNISSASTKTFNFDFYDAESYSQCAIFIGYYAKHTDSNYVQLGNYQFFVTGETPIEDVNASPAVLHGEIYRLDGTKIDAKDIKGIYINSGKVLISK